ncbi:MAG: hypothetical protein IAE91_07465 [Ignavibacteriaceae bacterium]|nr:hypothetical protein [Ignavibacteriaceae bacterium]
MDSSQLYREFKSKKNIEISYAYAINASYKSTYYDEAELLYYSINKDEIIFQIIEEIQKPDRYSPSPAFAYFPPKNKLCFRRMIHIPFKDLVIRFAFVNIIAKYLDSELSETCFANRRAKGEDAKTNLTEDFAKGPWSNFCKWQVDCRENYRNVLRTDISAFYDSVSHENLITSVTSNLRIKTDNYFIEMLSKLLAYPVASYNSRTKTIKEVTNLKQGLCTGNDADSFLANIYLKDIDFEMSKFENSLFGRYNDDIRIFSKSKEELSLAILTLQEQLLAKGLNLNSSKTISDTGDIESDKALISNDLDDYFDFEILDSSSIEIIQNEDFENFIDQYETDNNIDALIDDFLHEEEMYTESLITQLEELNGIDNIATAENISIKSEPESTVLPASNSLTTTDENRNRFAIELLDRDFYDIDTGFDINQITGVSSDDEAKKYCKAFQNNIKRNDRTPEHIKTLSQITKFYPGSSKHSTWCIMSNLVQYNVKPETIQQAVNVLFELIQDKTVKPYARYRLLHNFFKLRGPSDQKYRISDRLEEKTAQLLKEILISNLAEPALEIVTVSITGLSALGTKLDEINKLVAKHAISSPPDQIKNTLFYLESFENNEIEAIIDPGNSDEELNEPY